MDLYRQADLPVCGRPLIKYRPDDGADNGCEEADNEPVSFRFQNDIVYQEYGRI